MVKGQKLVMSKLELLNPALPGGNGFERSSGQGSSARNRDRPEFRSTIFVNFEEVRMAQAIGASQDTEHATPFIEGLGQGNKLSNIANDRNHPRVVSDSIKNQGSLSILDSRDTILLFVEKSFPHFGTGLRTYVEAQQLSTRGNFEIGPFRDVLFEPLDDTLLNFL